MATQNVCFYNKYGYCKYADKCRKLHEKETCEKSNCEITECKLRHPIMCKYFRDYGFCKFTDWCKFSHKLVTSDKSDDIKKLEKKLQTLEDKVKSKENDEIKKLKDNLKTVETELEKNNAKVRKLESDIDDMNKKMSEKEQTISKINKKYNLLKEKVTLVFDLEAKFDVIEKKVEKIITSEKGAVSEDLKSDISSENTENFKCNMCDFVGKNKFGLKIHVHKKHSTAKFNCFTCDFTCETRSELLQHNEKYYYSHRQVLNKDYEKHILYEIQQMDEDGFLVHRTLDW